MNMKMIKAIGIGASVFGALVSMAGDWANKKQIDSEIAKKASEAVAEALKKESN